MKTKSVILAIALSVIMTATVSVVGTLALKTVLDNRQDRYYIYFDSSSVDYANIEKFNEVRDLLNKKFIENIDENTLLEGAVAGMTASLGDPYTMYVDKETMELMSADSEGEYSGIGVTISIPSSGIGILILDVNENGPAYEVGILPGDRVIKVNDEDFSYSNDLNYVATRVRGEVDTPVKIEILREGEENNLVFNITRKIVNTIDVVGEMFEGATGYLRIRSFTQDSPTEFADKFNELALAGMDSLIIDVRDNPGGSLYAIVNIADMLMEKGIITYTIDRDGKREDFKASGTGIDMPIVILVNGYSASASEMLAGALRDNGLATVIGTTTFGKGLVQGVYDLEDGSGMRITIAKYYTPSDVCIQDIGIIPDIEVLPLEEYTQKLVSTIPREDDVQLQRALDELAD